MLDYKQVLLCYLPLSSAISADLSHFFGFSQCFFQSRFFFFRRISGPDSELKEGLSKLAKGDESAIPIEFLA